MNIYRLPRRFISLFRITVVLTVFAMAFGPTGLAYAQSAGAAVADNSSAPAATDTSASPPATGSTDTTSSSPGASASQAQSPADTTGTSPASDNANPHASLGSDNSKTPTPASDNANGNANTPTVPSSNGKKSTTSTTGGVSQLSSSGQDTGTVDPQRDQQRKALVDSAFKPDPLAGSLNYSYPLKIPPGRNGLQPDLSLNYSSQPGSDVNTIGYAWSVSIPTISRINRTGTNDLYSGEDYFYSSLDGELASTSPGVYGALSDKGSFNKYVYSTSANCLQERDTACEVAPLLGKLADLCVALPALLRVRFSGEVAGRVDVENAPLFGVELSELCQSVWCHRFPKVGLVVDCTSHLVLASVPMWGPSPDVEHWKKALRETLKNIRPKVVLADAGYDSEESHRFAREEHGIPTIISNRVGRPTKKLPRGKYRKQKH